MSCTVTVHRSLSSYTNWLEWSVLYELVRTTVLYEL